VQHGRGTVLRFFPPRVDAHQTSNQHCSAHRRNGLLECGSAKESASIHSISRLSIMLVSANCLNFLSLLPVTIAFGWFVLRAPAIREANHRPVSRLPGDTVSRPWPSCQTELPESSEPMHAVVPDGDAGGVHRMSSIQGTPMTRNATKKITPKIAPRRQ
jgi:hypothetical protein